MGRWRFVFRRRQLVNQRTGSWEQLSSPARLVRTQVFILEQGISADDEWDAWDALSVHLVVESPDLQPLATGRLLPAQQGVSKIGRLAVLAYHRQQGIGAAMLHQLVALARQRGDQNVQLHAQTQAQSFYERLGFCAHGPVFQEVGINHVMMRLTI